ncbi:protein unc-79 homolog isoform X2 [Cimex lectularius]|uniref:Protein unc-79 homolog n=1 Tax=Cimex lectularius TaxID=79782 RepID=A0A8I6SFF5_CIMLE|nr:protein unc-79 homolog isoform X2 [Cimex lectularius]
MDHSQLNFSQLPAKCIEEIGSSTSYISYFSHNCLSIMGTRAAAFAAKIRNLHDYHLRLLHNVVPLPTGTDVANTIKYFSQTLLTVLKDVPSSPIEMLKYPDKDAARLALYPNLDYKGLYNAIVELVDVAPLMLYGLQPFGEALLQCLGCLMPFLDSDMIDSLPYLTASTMSILPSSLHQEIVHSLYFYILPFTITRITHDGKECYASQSVSAVLMMIFQYSEDMAHHCQILECLMKMKQNLVKDMLCVIAHGTSTARASAAKLLFYYWPTFNSSLFERKAIPPKFTSWVPFLCQRDMCPNSGAAEAAKVCYDHCISITFATDSPPPLYLCIECANEIHREHPNQMFYDILHPMQQCSVTCENKNCRSSDKSIVSICFTPECASFNGNHPIRYCAQCDASRHNKKRGGDHMLHTCLPKAWTMPPDMLVYLVEAIVSLLKEARPTTPEISKDMTDIQAKATMLNAICDKDSLSTEERQLMGRFGVWLLVGLCVPTENISSEILGRLLSMLFHWFHVTAYTFDDQAECTLERLKTDYVCGWLNEVCQAHFDVFVSCLLPHPPDYARVGGHWDMLVTKTTHLKKGLNRLFCLVPYEVITTNVWDYVMPHWLEAIVRDVPDKELCELKMLLSKILDPDMSPLGFDAKKLYHFVAVRFKRTSPKVQEQALRWLQVLTALEIMIPTHLLFSFFEDGLESMKATDDKEAKRSSEFLKDDKQPRSISPVVEDDSGPCSALSDDEEHGSRVSNLTNDIDLKLSCCVLMLDLVLKQLERHEIEKHTGIHTVIAQDVCRLLQVMMLTSWLAPHTCEDQTKNDCNQCELSVAWHQLALQLIEYIAQENLAHPPDPPLEEVPIEECCHSKKSPPEGDRKSNDPKSDVVINMPLMEIHTVGGIMTATVETVVEQLDLAPIIMSEKVIPAIARSVTITDSDVATATAHVAKPTLVGENDETVESGDEDMEDFWQTSVGKFRFTIDELPQQLQYIHQLLKEIAKTDDPEVLYYMLNCLYLMCLHGDALSKAVKHHKGFIIWCQENLLIKNLWELCNAEHSHICEVCVPILLHCITLPSGSDAFWRVLQDEFHSTDWRIRFVAVERVTVIVRFMDSTPLRANFGLQGALTNAFCYLISSLDDSNVQVAQRATLYLGTIHDTAIKSLIMCLESQFDSVIVDRPMVLQSLYQLHNCLSDRHILTWEFFLNRFDTLFLEAQINLEKTGDITYLRDLRNTDLMSETFMRKLQRAQEALSQSDSSSVKTLSASFGSKWPYKRTMSAPATMVPRQDTKQEKEKVYSRQYSAPILKRKTSRFGLGQLIGSMPPNNTVVPPDGHIHAMNPGDDVNLAGLLHRVLDLEEADKETMHLLIFLFLQFLSRPEQAYPSDEKILAKTQSVVLKHLYLLLGYNQNEKGFHIPPNKLRSCGVFNVFIYNLPQVLDQNHLMGGLLMNTCLLLLHYCPCPPHYSPDCQTVPTYSLWYLEPHVRRSWLMSTLVFLYKYQYSQPPQSTQVQSLVRIVLNSLDAQHHVCKRIPTTLVINVSTRSRDVSQPSLGVDGDHNERYETPPLSPMYSGGNGSHVSSIKTKGCGSLYQKAPGSMETHWEEDINEGEGKLSTRRFPEYSYSTEAEETESEIAAIPESYKSDSTVHGSSHGSFEEVLEDVEKKRGEKFQRPVWLCSTENQISQHEHRDNLVQKLGLKEGMKMLVSSSIFPVSAQHSEVPHLAVATVTNPLVVQDPGIAPNSKPEISLQHTMSTSTSSSTPTPTPSTYPPWQMEQPFKHLATQHGQERLLPIGASRQVPKPLPKSPRTEGYGAYGSPDSPLSKMDIITVGSPVELDTENSSFFDSTSHSSVTQLEIPQQERLLPIGAPHTMANLVQHVRQVLGVHDNKQIDHLSSLRTPTEVDSLSLSPVSKQDSFERSDLQASHASRTTSPRRLCKQVALESPPPQLTSDTDHVFYRKPVPNAENTQIGENKENIRKSKNKRGGPFSLTPHTSADHEHRGGTWYGVHAPMDTAAQQACHASFDLKQSDYRVGDECVYERCGECGTIKEEYSDDELGLCIVILGTFIHREPALAAPLLPEILTTVTKLALTPTYAWQNESSTYLPGGAISVAHQFLRCVLHQLAPNGVFLQMFQTNMNETNRMQFFRSVAQALLDFNELNPIAPLQLLLESLNSKKTLPDTLPVILHNVACYLDCLPLEAGLGPGTGPWSSLIGLIDVLFRRLSLQLQIVSPLPLLRIMLSTLRVPGITTCKSILDPFSKVLSFSLQNLVLKYQYLVDLCYLCNRAFSREREKQALTRTVVFELVQALKFKTNIPESNFLLLINFVLQDAGGRLPPTVAFGDVNNPNPDTAPVFNTFAAEVMRQHLTDALDFLADIHTITKLKMAIDKIKSKGMSLGLSEDTFGGTLKSGIAQFVALEMTRGGSSRDNRSVSRYLPWLYNAPPTIQQGSREFLECVAHVRLLSWLLIGALTHTALHTSPCLPVPQEATCHIADHVQVIITGFAEQSKQSTLSVVHMSSLFHVFVLCQLWTVYLEQGAASNLPSSDAHSVTMSILFDFWGKVTPSILQLVSNTKLAEMVNTHFLGLLEALLECKSAVLNKLMPVWSPVLYSQQIPLPGQIQMRLQNCNNFAPSTPLTGSQNTINPPCEDTVLLRWLQRLQFKMGQTELQSSAATQLYSA